MGDTSSTLLYIDILLKKRDITIQEFRQMKFKIVELLIWHGWVHGNKNQENLLEWVALRNLDLKIKCHTKIGTKMNTVTCPIPRQVNG